MTKKEGAQPQLWEFICSATISNMPQPLKDAFLEVNPDPAQLQAMHDKDARAHASLQEDRAGRPTSARCVRRR